MTECKRPEPPPQPKTFRLLGADEGEVEPTDILIPLETEVLQRANQDKLACPCCGSMLSGYLWIEQHYTGVELLCSNMSGCGFREF